MAVVGGSLGGLTAAVAAARQGCEVVLFEQSSRLMPEQRGSFTRRVHPNINRWPEQGSEDPSTDLPFLNWTAAPAAEVSLKVEVEVREFLAGPDGSKVRLLFNHEVQDIEFDDREGRAVVMASGPLPLRMLTDVIILSIGMWRERTLPSVRTFPYWGNDNLNLPQNLDLGRPRRFLVSGVGDGGLVDALRLRLSDFDSAAFAAELLSEDDLLPTKARLIDIDAEAQQIDPTSQSEFLWDCYQRLPVPERVTKAVRGHLRNDTEVALNGISRAPLVLPAANLNRFLAFLLLRDEELKYYRGRIEEVRLDGPGETGYTVELVDNGGAASPLRVDDVILRHGFTPDLGGNTAAGLMRHMVRASPPEFDPTDRPLWPLSFYGKQPSRWVPAATAPPDTPPGVPTRPTGPIAPGSDAAREAILARMAVREYKGVYVLGSYATRVTFSSQQYRAFNLVWALQECGRLGPGTKAAVVGAGLAGMSAAVAARKVGAEVTLFEAENEVLHLQADNRTRYIHPNTYDWPEPWSEVALTEFPCLNWYADMAEQVIRVVARQWREARAGIALKTGHRVDQVRRSAGGPVVVFGTPHFGTQSFDCVILAIGFGIEKSVPKVPPPSYWYNDNLDQTVKVEPKPRRFLVTGCGDGGLIDALRMSIHRYNHKRFVDEFLSGDLRALKQELLAIEADVPEIADEDQQGIELYGRYQRLPIPDELKKHVQLRLRMDTEVELNSDKTTPLSMKASVLNRFAVFLLLQLNRSTKDWHNGVLL